MEEKIRRRIEDYRREIIRIGETVWKNAELGFKEYKTSQLVSRVFRACGLRNIQTELAVTGVKAYLKDPVPGEMVIAVIGEMDALPIKEHPDANPETGASHCCGHNAQVAAMLGAAYALSDPEISGSLDGNVAFMAVPAEEFVEIGFKKSLVQAGAIGFCGGKSELIRIGAFDDISAAIGHHALPSVGLAVANGTTNGFVNKIASFRGRAAHAADAPHKGLDALNAAMLALHAVDAQRETFRDEEHVRIHSFLPQAGEAVNIVAETAVVESSVRAKSMEAVWDASMKYDRAMKAGAMALGCDVTIDTVPGYLPTIPVKDSGVLTRVLAEYACDGCPVEYRGADFHENGSTDFGDLSHLLPVLQFRTGGYDGALHHAGLRVTNEELAYVRPAEIFALAVWHLLSSGAAQARKLLRENPPRMTREQYVACMESAGKRTVFYGGRG